MILALSNIDEHPNEEVLNAWVSKFEQCYQKAKLSFNHEGDFVNIQDIYEKTQKQIKKIRRKGLLCKILTIVLPIVVFVGLNIAFWGWILFSVPEPVNSDKEVARLEAIVVEVEEAIKNKEFDLAMMQAKSIDFYPNHESLSDLERQWDIKIDYLIKKVIDAATEEGIEMEYPTDTVDEKDQKNNTSSYNYEKSKEKIQDNIDEFNKYINEVEDMWDQYTNSYPTN